MIYEYRLLNNLGFSLYVVSPTSYMIAISEKGLSRSYNNKSKCIVICYEMIKCEKTLLYILVRNIIILVYDNEAACDCSHITGHIIWGYRPRVD